MKAFRIFPMVLLLAGSAAVTTAVRAAGPPDTPVAIQKLLSQYGCLACHGLVHKQVGPGFAQVAARYRADPAGTESLPARIRNGSVGRWGRLVMPRQPSLGEPESQALAQWVLARPNP